MSWRDRLRPASFRGVRFFFEAVRDQGGRWTVRHDFPGRRLPFVEDQGPRPREIRLRAYLLGPDYLEQLEQLLDALDLEGAGELVHPTLGSFNVALAEPYSIEQTSRDGGYATVELSFLETEGALVPTAADVPGPRLEALAAQVSEETAASLPDLVDVAGEPEVARAAMADASSPFGELMRTLELEGPLQEVAAWRARVEDFLEQGVELASSPEQFAGELRDLVADVLGLAGGRLRALAIFERLLGVQPVFPTPGGGRTARTAQANARATDNLARMLALAGACSAASSAPWSSLEQALEARVRLLEYSDDLGEELDDDNLRRLLNLGALLAQSVPPPDRGLPRELVVVPVQTVPSLVLAYQLDGNVAREQDLVDRNRPRHPGFLPGGKPLEVLDVA